MLPVYILIRTSCRPRYFARMMETVKQQTYKNITTIVHSDDPRDEYVTGDIIIHGTAFGAEYGNGTYNLYNNALLRAIPKGPGWFHFIDDDDEYAAPDVIERIVAASKPGCVNVAHVQRVMHRGVVQFPDKWGTQKSYQTECFFLHTDHKGKAKWWGNKGGDHHYSKQLTRILPINWIENLLICKAQEAKGHGNKLDLGLKKAHRKLDWPDDKMICVLGLLKQPHGPKEERIRQGELKYMEYATATRLEKDGFVKITYPCESVRKGAVRQIYQLK